MSLSFDVNPVNIDNGNGTWQVDGLIWVGWMNALQYDRQYNIID